MYLWDTNIVIYYLQRQFTAPAEEFIDTCIQEARPAISAISEIELLCWRTPQKKEIKVLQSFIQDCLVIELEQSIKQKKLLKFGKQQASNCLMLSLPPLP